MRAGRDIRAYFLWGLADSRIVQAVRVEGVAAPTPCPSHRSANYPAEEAVRCRLTRGRIHSTKSVAPPAAMPRPCREMLYHLIGDFPG